LKSLDLGASGAGFFLFVALAVTMMMAVLLGMGMPAVPAYVNVALLMGPLLIGLGIATFTAASLTKADPMATGFSAVRSGIIMFVIPFVFAFYPELLLIDDAVIQPGLTGGEIKYIEGYDGKIHWGPLAWMIARLAVALYFLASALARWDRTKLDVWEWVLRLAVALAVIAKDPMIYWPGLAAAVIMIVLHVIKARKVVAA